MLEQWIVFKSADRFASSLSQSVFELAGDDGGIEFWGGRGGVPCHNSPISGAASANKRRHYVWAPRQL
jgi:hypothetical protein